VLAFFKALPPSLIGMEPVRAIGVFWRFVLLLPTMAAARLKSG
jgi:hypothetical protein